MFSSEGLQTNNVPIIVSVDTEKHVDLEAYTIYVIELKNYVKMSSTNFATRSDLIEKLLHQQQHLQDDQSSVTSGSSGGQNVNGRSITRNRSWNDCETMIEEHLHEVYDKLPNLEKQIWGKLIVMENNRRTAKAYLRHPVITIDGSDTDFDGLRVGLAAFANSERSAAIADIHADLDQGVKMKIDPDGNLWAKRMCQTAVFLKPLYRNRANDLFVVDQRPVKVFDIRRFKEILVQELKQSRPDRRRLERCCLVCLKFSVDHYDLLRTPSWILLVHLVAMELLNLVLPKDNDFSSPSSSFIAPSASPPLMGQPMSGGSDLSPPNRVNRTRTGGVSKRIHRNNEGANNNVNNNAMHISNNKIQQLPPLLPTLGNNNAASGALHCLAPNGADWSQAIYEPGLRGVGPNPSSLLAAQQAAQGNVPPAQRMSSTSMLDLRQINKYISPPYFDRSNPQRTSRGGPGHQRFYEKRHEQNQNRHHLSMSDLHQQSAHHSSSRQQELHQRPVQVAHAAALAARTHLMKWKSQDSGIGSGSTGFNSFDSNK